MRLVLAHPSLETKLLRADIRNDLRRGNRIEGEGGDGGRDFYVPFWSDAKQHVRGLSDLRIETTGRVEASAQRRRLYPMLAEGFLNWWEERRRRRNEPFTLLERPVRGRAVIESLGVVRVENNLSFQIGDDGLRIVYPYFCDEPELNIATARIGLWLMSQALPDFRIEDMRILDVVRGISFSIEEGPLTGTEETELRGHYGRLLARWHELRATYD